VGRDGAAYSSRARGLTGLAPHLPASLLAQALDAATAITSDSSRAEALAGLAPHLPASLLAQALSSAFSSERAILALLERAWSLHARGMPLPYVAMLRDCLTGVNRDSCLRILAASMRPIDSVDGTTAVRQCADAVIDAYRWWP
jgi:hypothetical protein